MNDYPRCRTCKWWDVEGQLKGYGWCMVAETRFDDNGMPFPVHVTVESRLMGAAALEPGVGDGKLSTNESFGCVHHERRDDA